MKDAFKAIKISQNVYWVGAIDWSIRDFHGYATKRGTTYNAFLIIADKITLVDTVKKPFQDEMLARIASVIDPEKIDYIVSNHAEMDHSGCLPFMIDLIQPEKVYASTQGIKALKEHFNWDKQLDEVQDGNSISLGNMNITFLATPMLHWPDSMISFLDKDGILFTQDACGMHLATGDIFADQHDKWILDFEAKKYFANILNPYSSKITTFIKRYRELNLPVKIMAPDHGPLRRNDQDIKDIVDLYEFWASGTGYDKVIIIYDTMWGSTGAMARVIADSLIQQGIDTLVLSLSATHRSDVATHLLDAKALIVGSPTLNNDLYPTIADCLTYLRGLKFQNLMGAYFGSFGWNGKAFTYLKTYFEEMNINIVSEVVKAKYVPNDNDYKNCQQLGENIAKVIKAE